MSPAKIPSNQQGKLIYLSKNQKKQKKRPISQVFFFLPAFSQCCPLVSDCPATLGTYYIAHCLYNEARLCVPVPVMGLDHHLHSEVYSFAMLSLVCIVWRSYNQTWTVNHKAGKIIFISLHTSNFHQSLGSDPGPTHWFQIEKKLKQVSI